MESSQLLALVRANYGGLPPRQLGPGNSPAVLVVDYVAGFTSPDSPIGGNWDKQVECAARIVDAAHRSGKPCIFTTIEFSPPGPSTNLLFQKTPHIDLFLHDSKWSTLDQRLTSTDKDIIVHKSHGSAFFGTSLASQLCVLGVDTLLIAGCVTSGCVRATTVDAAQYGFRPMVVKDAVADRSLLANETNLIDIEQRYGDVISIDQALSCLSIRVSAEV